MKVIEKCPVCNSSNLTVTPAVLSPFIGFRIFGWMPARVVEGGYAYPICKTMVCKDCTFVFCDMRFDDEEMRKLYRNYRGQEYIEQRTQFEPDYGKLNETLQEHRVKYMDEIEKLIPIVPRRVLDWGGASGINTPFPDSDIDIYDIGDDVLKRGRKVQKPEPPYDLIVCSNVLEHVSYPIKILQEIKQLMTAETYIYIEVPFEFTIPRQWHEHINMFGEKSVHKLAELAGLQVVAENLVSSEHENIFQKMVVCKCQF